MGNRGFNDVHGMKRGRRSYINRFAWEGNGRKATSDARSN